MGILATRSILALFQCTCQAPRSILGVYNFACLANTRVSKSGRHAYACLRKIVHNLRKILAFERETVKITSFNLILLILTIFVLFYGLFGTFSRTIFFGWTF